MGQVFIGGPWSLAINGKGHQYRIFLDNGTFASESVLVFKFQLCPSPLAPLGGAGDFGSGCSSGSKFSPLPIFGLMTCSLGLFSPKSNLVSH